MIPLWWLACGTPSLTEEAGDLAPTPIGLAECAVCGMTVGEQPLPRAQLVYRDGTHEHLCSVGELRAQVQAPNPHGEPVGVYVEGLPADLAPGEEPSNTEQGPWLRAEEAWFVVDFPRERIMGLPALAFRSEARASAEAQARGGRVLRWSALEQTPFHLLPEAPAE